MRSVFTCALVPLLAAPLHGQAPLPRIQPNQNRVPAGTLKNGVLTLQLDVVRAMWFPDGNDNPGIDVFAFAETGHAPSAPGPLVRVPVGTEIRTTLHNALDSAIVVEGLSGGRTLADSVHVEPGETRELVTRAATAGTFLYYAATNLQNERNRNDHVLRGAFIVDEPGRAVNDRVLVLLQYINRTRIKPMVGTINEINTINGRTWPGTERLHYDLKDTIRWRVINASLQAHAMHLHGAYYTVLSHGTQSVDSSYPAAERPRVVTERLGPLTTMTMQWTPVHAGNWLFHCHITPHIVQHPPLGDMKASGPVDDMAMMGGMVMGVLVRGEVAADPRPRRNLRLVVQQFDSVADESGPAFSYSLGADTGTPNLPGPIIVLTRNQPTAITVVNHAQEPTAVHWHGLEIQSYYDGPHGFAGHDMQLAPEIAPSDSFIALMTPPRAGTFMYHTHFDEERQQRGGLYGPLVVLNPGEKWDAEHERMIMLGSGRAGLIANIFVNGVTHPTLEMISGETYRIRIMHIHIGAPSTTLSLLDGDKPLEWHLIARDGLDLPTARGGVRPAVLQLAPGQTYDVLFKAPAPGTYQLKVATFSVEGVPLATTGDIIVKPRQ